MVEPNGTGGTVTKQVTALGLSKATHEFLTQHYFALDSAEWWDRILKELLPEARFPGAVVRRTAAVKVFDSCHVAPSHQRYPHPVWVDSFCLIADLLLGCGVGRYLGSLQGPAFQQEVAVRGFSSGSYSGLCLLHILWPIPGVVTRGCLGAIACPPSLLKMNLAKDGDRLHLIHYEGDELCCWKPGRQQLQQSCSKFTYIMNESSAYKGHFGPSEHGYSQLLGLDLPQGMMQLSTLLFLRPEAAAKAKCDATPLRLISWQQLCCIFLRGKIRKVVESCRWVSNWWSRVTKFARKLSLETDSLTWWVLETCSTNLRPCSPCFGSLWCAFPCQDWFISLT